MGIVCRVYLRKAEKVCGMHKKRHISVNLGKFQDDPPPPPPA